MFLESEGSDDVSVKKSLSKKIDFYKNEIKFFSKKLDNKNFLQKAPSSIIQEQKKKLNEAQRNLKLLLKK